MLICLYVIFFANTVAVRGNRTMNAVFDLDVTSSLGNIFSFISSSINPVQLAGSIMILGLGALFCFLLMKFLIMLFKVSLFFGSLYALIIMASSGVPGDFQRTNHNSAPHTLMPPAKVFSSPDSSEAKENSLLATVTGFVQNALDDIPVDIVTDMTESLGYELGLQKKEKNEYRF